MRCQFEYKQLWRGGQVFVIPSIDSSQRCACCNQTEKDKHQSSSKFECQIYDYIANADIPVTRHILTPEPVVLACAEGGGQTAG